MYFYTGRYIGFATPAPHRACFPSIDCCGLCPLVIEMILFQGDSMRHRLPMYTVWHRNSSPGRQEAAYHHVILLKGGTHRATSFRPSTAGDNPILTEKLAPTLRPEHNFPSVARFGHVLLPVALVTQVNREHFAALSLQVAAKIVYNDSKMRARSL